MVRGMIPRKDPPTSRVLKDKTSQLPCFYAPQSVKWAKTMDSSLLLLCQAQLQSELSLPCQTARISHKYSGDSWGEDRQRLQSPISEWFTIVTLLKESAMAHVLGAGEGAAPIPFLLKQGDSEILRELFLQNSQSMVPKSSPARMTDTSVLLKPLLEELPLVLRPGIKMLSPSPLL